MTVFNIPAVDDLETAAKLADCIQKTRALCAAYGKAVEFRINVSERDVELYPCLPSELVLTQPEIGQAITGALEQRIAEMQDALKDYSTTD